MMMQDRKRAVADALTRARNDAGDGVPSYAQIERIMLAVLGDEGTPRSETIRDWHADGVLPERAPVEAMRVVAHIYRVELGDIHPALERRWAKLLLLPRILDEDEDGTLGQNRKFLTAVG